MTETSSMIRVLIAEDDALTRSTMAELLTSLGHMVVAEVGSGAEAIEKAKQFTPDAVLLDVHMPGSSGVQAAEEIAAMLPGTAVLLITGDMSVTLSASEVARSGAVALLSKPTPPATLDMTMRLAVSRARELLAAKNEAALARQQLEANRKRTASCSAVARIGRCRWWILRRQLSIRSPARNNGVANHLTCVTPFSYGVTQTSAPPSQSAARTFPGRGQAAESSKQAPPK
jgi:CheY-like chemotaxis protein